MSGSENKVISEEGIKILKAPVKCKVSDLIQNWDLIDTSPKFHFTLLLISYNKQEWTRLSLK